MTRLEGVMLFVAELEPVVAFYRDGVGVGFAPVEGTRTTDCVEFDTGGAAFSLHQIPQDLGVKLSPAPRETGSCKPIRAVDDRGCRRTSRSRGGGDSRPPGGQLDFADPGGNVLGARER